jgi:coenzyme PQQ synthesis protein D (PqqD)
MKEQALSAPLARDERLVVQELSDELLVYDLERHRGHCLNPVAALVWRHCNGRTTVPEIATALNRELGLPPDEEAVWLALGRLSKAHLIQQRVPHPGSGDRATRRAMLHRLAAVGAVALVSSIVAPGASASGSVPAICITTCCGACQSGQLGNNCKCCLAPNGAAVCGKGCGQGSNQCGNDQCIQLPNCCNVGQIC